MRRRGATRAARKPRSLATALRDFDAAPQRTEFIEQEVEGDPKAPLLMPHEVHGVPQPGMGWSPVPELPAGEVYRCTTDQVGGLFPFLSARQLPAEGPLAGIDADTGSGLYASLPLWLKMGLLSNTNILVYGKAGRGKSFIIKSFVWRSICHGTRVFIAGDIKDEYAPICHELGCPPMAVGPGLAARMNPLDGGPLLNGWARLSDEDRLQRFDRVRGRWLVLLEALVAVGGAHSDPSTSEAISKVLDELTYKPAAGRSDIPEVIIPQVVQALENPSDELVAATRFRDVREFLDAMRQPTDALAKMTGGVLRGMFDGPTTVNPDWDAPIQSVSLRSLKPLGDEAIAVATTCVNSWSQSLGDVARDAPYRIMVRDEVWRVMQLGDAAVRSLDSDLRLGRDQRQIQIIAAHKPSDMTSVGEAGSRASRLASQIGALCDTKILLAQDADVADDLQEQLGLSAQEDDAIRTWAWRGRHSLWKIGDQSRRVIGVSSPIEQALFETNPDETNSKTDEQEVAA